MKVLVTGARGFLGKWTVAELRRKGYDVYGTDRNASDETSTVDIRNFDEVTDLIANIKPDVIVHLAAVTGATGENEIEQSIRQCLTNYQVNALGTANICEAAKTVGVKKLIYTSSFATYARTGPDRLPITEQTPVDLQHAYATSKYTGELIVRNYCQDFGFQAAIFRLPFIVGEGQKEKNVFREFLNEATQDKELIIYGDGSQLRTFLHAVDVVTAFESTIKNFDSLSKPELFVLGNTPISMKEFAEKVVLHVGKGVTKFVESSRAFSQYSDFTKATSLLGWQPTLSVDDMIERVLAADY